MAKGDKFFPIGMNGSKKVSDYLTDIKKKSVEKQQQLVLTDKSGIIWVIRVTFGQTLCNY